MPNLLPIFGFTSSGKGNQGGNNNSNHTGTTKPVGLNEEKEKQIDDIMGQLFKPSSDSGASLMRGDSHSGDVPGINEITVFNKFREGLFKSMDTPEAKKSLLSAAAALAGLAGPLLLLGL